MTSPPRNKLIKRLKEIDELIAARDSICSGKVGKPAKDQGAAVISSATLLLSAIFEAYIEEIFDLSLDKIHKTDDNDDANAKVEELKKYTSHKNNNVNIHNINNLFFYIGIPWIMSHENIRWKKFHNQKVQELIKELSMSRNSIAHGVEERVTKQKLLKWKNGIENVSIKIDEVVKKHIKKITQTNPW